MGTHIFEAFLFILWGFQGHCTFLGSVLKVIFSSNDSQYHKVMGTFFYTNSMEEEMFPLVLRFLIFLSFTVACLVLY